MVQREILRIKTKKSNPYLSCHPGRGTSPSIHRCNSKPSFFPSRGGPSVGRSHAGQQGGGQSYVHFTRRCGLNNYGDTGVIFLAMRLLIATIEIHVKLCSLSIIFLMEFKNKISVLWVSNFLFLRYIKYFVGPALFQHTFELPKFTSSLLALPNEAFRNFTLNLYFLLGMQEKNVTIFSNVVLHLK